MKRSLRAAFFAVFLLFAAIAVGCSVHVQPPPPEGGAPALPHRRAAMVEGLSIRPCPQYSPECGTIATLHYGQIVNVLEYQGNWARIQIMGSGVEGWVNDRKLGPVQ